MGRPLNKKYFGGRNASTSGSLNQALVADARLPGTKVSGISNTTAGSYTGTQVATTTVTFPAPAIANGVTATGTPTFTYLSGSTLTGTQTVAYTTGTGSVTATIGSTTLTFTPTLTTGSNTITNTNGTAVTVTSGSYIQGTSFTTGGTVTTTSGLAINTTYYVAATTSSSTTVTLASSYANAIAGTAITFTGGSTAISNGAVTIGTTYSSIASIALVSGGTGITAANVASMIATPLALTQSTSSGAGATLTSTGGSSLFSITGTTLTQAGDGYLGTLSETPTITGTTVTTIASGAYGTITVSGTGTNVITLGTAQAAGTFYVGQVVTFTGSASTNFIDSSYSSGKSYVVTATNGTSTLTLSLTTGSAPTGGAAGAVTGLSIVLYSVTLTSVSELQSGFTITTTGTAGGLTAGTYYVIGTPSTSLNQLTLSSTYQGNAFVITSTTTSDTITTTATQYLGLTYSAGGTTSIGVATLAAEVTSGYSGRYPGILCQAITTGSTLRQDSTILKQENYQRFKIENTDGTAYCKLVTQTPTTAGTFAINATDSAGGTYWVAKMTNHKARLIANTGTQFTSGSQVKWTFGSAVANTTVTIDNG